MNKTIIAIYGRQGEGKSGTIKLAYEILITRFPNAKFKALINFDGDILTTVTLDNIKIGFESQGDPNSRIVNKEDTLRKLANEKTDVNQLGGCDIIVCATRTDGKTVRKVDEIAHSYNYHTIWMSSFFSPTLDKQTLNFKAATNIVDMITSLIVGQI